MVYGAFILKVTGLVLLFFNLANLVVVWFGGLSQLIMMEEKTPSTDGWEGLGCAPKLK